MLTRLNGVSDTELDRRWRALRAAMIEARLEAVVAMGSNDWLGGHLRWLTDMPATNGYPRTAVFHVDRPMTVIEMGPFGLGRSLDHDPVHRGVGRQVTRPAFTSIGQTNAYDAEVLAAELAGLRRVGVITPGALPHAVMAALRTLRGVEIVDATDLIDRIKAVKSVEEIANYRATCALQDAAFAHVLEVARPGLRDIDIANAAMARAQELGSDQGIVLCGSAPPGQAARFNPRHLQGRLIAPGDHLSILIEVNGPGGAYAEIARTLVFGKAWPALEEAFAAMLEAQAHTLSLMKPGADPAAIAAAHDAWMTARGLPAETRLYAHNQGADMVERPLIRADETLPLAEGQTFAVHPGYDDGSVFAVICDNYLIGASGPGACLHATDKRLFEIV